MTTRPSLILHRPRSLALLDAFAVFGDDRYQQRADKKSWVAFGDFLDETR